MIHTDTETLIAAGMILLESCHGAAKASGWWTNMENGQDLTSKIGETVKVNIPEKLCLIHSEVSEAMEGHRKRLMDDKLPHRTMLEVELADAVIRCFDLAGGIGLDLAGAIAAKLEFNARREDHRIEHRRTAANGKQF